MGKAPAGVPLLVTYAEDEATPVCFRIDGETLRHADGERERMVGRATGYFNTPTGARSLQVTDCDGRVHLDTGLLDFQPGQFNEIVVFGPVDELRFEAHLDAWADVPDGQVLAHVTNTTLARESGSLHACEGDSAPPNCLLVVEQLAWGESWEGLVPAGVELQFRPQTPPSGWPYDAPFTYSSPRQGRNGTKLSAFYPLLYGAGDCAFCYEYFHNTDDDVRED